MGLTVIAASSHGFMAMT